MNTDGRRRVAPLIDHRALHQSALLERDAWRRRYQALERAVTEAIDAELGDDVVALRTLLMDALAGAA